MMSPYKGVVSKTIDCYLHRRRARSRVDAEGRRGNGGPTSPFCYLLWLSDEVLLEIVSYLSMLQVSRLSQACSRLRNIIGPDVWKRGVFVPLSKDYVSLLRHQNFARVRSLILSGSDGEAL